MRGGALCLLLVVGCAPAALDPTPPPAPNAPDANVTPCTTCPPDGGRRGIIDAPPCDPTNPASCRPGTWCNVTTDVTGAFTSACVDDRALSWSRCTLSPPRIQLVAGQSQSLELLAFGVDGAVLPEHGHGVWSAASPLVDVQPGVVNAVLPGETTVSVTFGSTACLAQVQVLEPLHRGVRVRVLDEATGAPLKGVSVLINRLPPIHTNQDGVATSDFDGVILSASVFPQRHHWQTDLQPPARDLVFRLRKAAPASPPPLRTTFDLSRAQPPFGDDRWGLAGVAFSRPLTDLSPDHFFTPASPVEVSGVALPLGLFLDVRGGVAQDAFTVFSDDTNHPWLWGMGGRVASLPLADALSRVDSPTRMLDVFLQLGHRAYLTHRLLPLPTSDAVRLTPNVLAFTQTAWAIPPLPSGLEHVLLATGTHAGHSLLPLGITSGWDACDAMDTRTACKLSPAVDGLISCSDVVATPAVDECQGLQAGQLVVDGAPPHDGLEGRPLVTVAVATTPGVHARSAVLAHGSSVSGPSPNVFPANAFLPLPQGQWSPRHQTWTGSPPAGAHLMRVRVTLPDREWLVLAAATTSIQLPWSPLERTPNHVEVEALEFLTQQAATAFMETQGTPEPDGLAAFSSAHF